MAIRTEVVRKTEDWKQLKRKCLPSLYLPQVLSEFCTTKAQKRQQLTHDDEAGLENGGKGGSWTPIHRVE